MLAACSFAPGNALDTSNMQQQSVVTTKDDTYLVQTITPETIIRQNLAMRQSTQEADGRLDVPVGDPRKFIYHVEPQDILSVIVWDHPELSAGTGTALDSTLTSPSNGSNLPLPYSSSSPGGSAGATNQNDPLGYTVGPEGTIFFPYAGVVNVSGKTVDQIRQALTSRLARYIAHPQVSVRVLAFRSQQVQLTGEVKTPGTLSITDHALTLADALSRAGGATTIADMVHVSLIRDNKRSVINAYAMLNHGDMSQNVLLRGGDIVNVPDQVDGRIFVLGEVLKPATLFMNNGRMTLADAITGAQGIDNAAANVRQVFVFRGARDNPTNPEIYQLDMTQPTSILLASQFQMDKLDVVYVGTSAGVRFNRALALITPALSNLFFARQLTR
jgi:polysaccharide export outer membrane protein